MRRVGLALTAPVVVLLLATGVALGGAATGEVVAGATRCGGARWRIETLSDRPKLRRSHPTTVAALAVLRPQRTLTLRRALIERRIYRLFPVTAQVRRSANGGLVIVLRDRTGTIDAEIPPASCITAATALRKRQMAQARDQATDCRQALVVGVVSAATRATRVELRPLLEFACLD